MEAYQEKQPYVIQGFLSYLQAVRGLSTKTIKEYYLDIRSFLRFIKRDRGMVTAESLDNISIEDVDVAFIQSISLVDAHNYLFFVTDNGMQAVSRARKVTAIRVFFEYHTKETQLLTKNPMLDLKYPKKSKKSTPRYLTVDECIALLNAVDGKFKERDYCILTLCLNCGLRLSEICSLDINSLQTDGTLRVIGKGNKERLLPLNQACIDAWHDYLPYRFAPSNDDPKALFVTRQHTRISPSSVEKMVKKYLRLAGLDAERYSVHKLRHSAATMLYRNGVDVRTLQRVLGHDSLNTTMIYTHVEDTDIKSAIANSPLSNIRSGK